MRKWRVGTISMGILLVATGILLLLSELKGLSGAMLILRWWPAILIILGIEILAFIVLSKEDQPKLKFDGLSIFLTILIVLISSGVYATHSFVKSDFSNRVFNEIGFYKYESVLNKAYEVNAENINSLDIDNSYGNVKIEKYDGSSIKIDAVIVIKSNNETASALVEKLIEVSETQTLVIRTKNEGLTGNSNNRHQLSVNYTVKVPKELSYNIKNRYGDTTMEKLSGDIIIQAGFGKIEIRDIEGDVQIENSFGEIRVRDITGKVEIENEHGNIVYSNKEVNSKDISLINKMGSITAEINKNQQGSFEAITRFGQISLDGFESSSPTEMENNKQEWIETIGSESPRINLDAEHGEIAIIAR